MAILNGIIKKMTGSAGQLTFKTVNGQTVVSEKVTNVKNSRTAGQQRQRMKWVNVIHMYSGIAPLLKNGFEKKMAQQSDYNMFVKLNNSAAPVYLTKTDADGGACIAAPYQITQGSLPSIVISGEGAEAKTDIALGELSIDASTTVAEFSKAVVDSNPDYDYGDQLSFYNVLQRVNAETHIPYCNFSASYVVLDKDSAVKLWDLVNKAGFASVDGMLAHGDDGGDVLLKKIAEMLSGFIRKEDILTRYGDEEFIVILPNTKEENAFIFAERFRREIEKMEFIPAGEEERHPITISGGISSFPFLENVDENANTLIRYAEHALYNAKKRGKNKVVLFSQVNLDY